MTAEAAARRWFDEPQLAPLGAGHIHDTYLVTVAGARFVLQRLNEVVFTDTELLMAQTERLLRQWRRQSAYRAPELQLSKAGMTSERLGSGCWRMWEYLGDTAVVDPIETLAQARVAGVAFAALQNGLAGMPGPRLQDTISGFLQLRHYLRAFDEVAAAAPDDLQRLVRANRGLAQQLGHRNAYIHGDCKVNNLLFDTRREKVVAIIDFDTVMYGHWAWDLGDLVRSVCFSRGGADVDFFAACLQGFAQHQPLTNAREAVAAPAYIALMLGLRFLTDHLSGDRYFRVAARGENLQRAREQFSLCVEFQAMRARLLEAAEEVLRGE